MRIKCPHCSGNAKVRTSRSLSPISRELYYQCQNVQCGHTWYSLLSVIRTIVPSRTPNQKVYIPLEANVAATTYSG